MDIQVSRTALDGVLIIDTDFFRDERGFFIESYHRERYREHGLDVEFVQDNHSRSPRGVLRGLHYQDMTAPMAKLVRCTAGVIWDVAVDLRAGSPTLGQWVAVELNDKSLKQVFVPVGFAHGFIAMSESADVQYKCTGYYAPSSEGTILWDDPDLGIEWPITEPILSARDQTAMRFKEYLEDPAFVYQQSGSGQDQS